MTPAEPQDARSAEIAQQAETALRALAASGDPSAFSHLLHLTEVVGDCIAVAARTLANESSWSGVADIAGTTRQAAWARWRAH